jgi:hypothetical protein
MRKLSLLLMTLGLVGCNPTSQTHLTSPSGSTLQQIGNVEKPAEVKSTSGSITIPAGTTVVAREDVLEFQLQTQSVFNFQTEELSGAETEASPTPSETAAGLGIQVMFYAGIAAVLGGLALFGFAHTQSGLWVSAGGGLLIVAAKVVSMPIFGYLAIGCIGAGAAFFAAWYILKGRDDGLLAKEGLIKQDG